MKKEEKKREVGILFLQAATKQGTKKEVKREKVKKKDPIVTIVFRKEKKMRTRKKGQTLLVPSTRDKVWHGNVSGTCFFLGQRLRHEALPEFGVLDLQLVQLLRHVAAYGRPLLVIGTQVSQPRGRCDLLVCLFGSRGDVQHRNNFCQLLIGCEMWMREG
mgnify:CR=1 FL=1